MDDQNLKKHTKNVLLSDQEGETYQDQYIKLEKIAGYIRRAEGKIRKYDDYLKKLRVQQAKKNLQMIKEIGNQTKI